VAHSDQYDPVPGNNAAQATATPLAADVAVRKLVSNPHPVISSTVNYTLFVQNNGPDTAANVQLVDSFPAGALTVVGLVDVSQGTFDPATGTWTVGDLAAGATAFLTFTVRVDVVGPVVNTVVASSTTFDPNLANNQGQAMLVAVPPFVSKRSFLAR
jgi:uncharacterized repeat protein (TIGR01451 family)